MKRRDRARERGEKEVSSEERESSMMRETSLERGEGAAATGERELERTAVVRR